MRNIFRWEMKQTFSSKAFWGIGIALTAATLLMLLVPLSEEGYTGFDIFLEGCNNFNSFLLFFIGIYAAINVTGAFEERKIQAAVMAGNSRFSVMMAKLASFCLSIALFSVIALSASAVVAFSAMGLNGYEGSFAREVVARIAVYTLVEVSFSSVCFFISMLVKSLGAAVGVNLVAMLGLNTLAQLLLEKEWGQKVLRFTPVGQTFMLLADASTKNLVISAAASLIGLAVIMVLSYLKFAKEELK